VTTSPVLGAVSPHLDDLALSCGSLLAAHPGSSMVTVFAGGPPSVEPVTDWEALSGAFQPGADIVGARRAEDRQAAAMLGCDTLHLEHWDEQYRHAVYGYRGPLGEELVQAVAADLGSVVDRLDLSTWLIPLGLMHPDHKITATACLAVVDRRPDLDWLVYGELPYAEFGGERVNRLLGRLRERGFQLEPSDLPGPVGRGPSKRQVVDCYSSQVGPLGDGVTLAVSAPERIHRLSRST
jgi:LmbE family N-acetylglucosaminyl deacetylase